MSVKKTPGEMRSAERAAFARFLRREMDALDISQAELAHAVGVPSQRVQRWCDHNVPDAPGMPDVRLFPRDLAMRVLAWMAEPHHAHVVDRLELEKVRDHYHHLTRLIRECSDVTSLYARALEDGVIDDQERRQLIKELDEAIGAKEALRHALKTPTGTISIVPQAGAS